MTQPPYWTPTNVLGFLFAGAGLLLGGVAYARNDLSGVVLTACALLLGGGMWLVNSPLASAFVDKVRDVAPAFRGAPVVPAAERAGRREIDAVVVTEPTEPAAVAPAPRPRKRRVTDRADVVAVPAPPPLPPPPPPIAEAGLTDADLERMVGSDAAPPVEADDDRR
jgi:hypothetical protein